MLTHPLTFLGVPDWLRCLRVTKEFRLCARVRTPWAMAAAALEELNQFDACSYCDKKHSCKGRDGRKDGCDCDVERGRKADEVAAHKRSSSRLALVGCGPLQVSAAPPADAEGVEGIGGFERGETDSDWPWQGDEAEAAANAAPPVGESSFARKDPRRRPGYLAQPALARLQQMTAFTRACVRRLADYAEENIENMLATGETSWDGFYDVQDAEDDAEKAFYYELNCLSPVRSGIMHELAQLVVARNELFDGAQYQHIYLFRGDFDGRLMPNETTTLRMERDVVISSPFGFGDMGVKGKASHGLEGVLPGSDEHLKWLLDWGYEAEARLLDVFGWEQYERDFDVFGRIVAHMPKILEQLHEIEDLEQAAFEAEAESDAATAALAAEAAAVAAALAAAAGEAADAAAGATTGAAASAAAVGADEDART